MAKDPSGKEINALAQHIQNVLTPSTPFFFNTLYDPFREGADFVRGYPFSMREGAPTAISHGLWLNIPDYDAPTQLVKPRERNTRLSFFSHSAFYYVHGLPLLNYGLFRVGIVLTIKRFCCHAICNTIELTPLPTRKL